MKIKQKNIDAAREVRLWIGQIIVPGALLAFSLFPELRVKAVNGVTKLRNTFRDKFIRKEK